MKKNGWKWRTAETADLAVLYYDWDGKLRTYRADFLIEERLLVEVKPSKLNLSRIVRMKQQAADAFCELRGLDYRIEDVDRLTDKEITILHQSGEIKFTDRYEKLFQERFANVN